MRKLKRKIDFLGLFSVKSFTHCTAHDRAVFHPLPGHFDAQSPEGENVVLYDLWSRTLGITTYQDSWQEGFAFVQNKYVRVCMNERNVV